MTAVADNDAHSRAESQPEWHIVTSEYPPQMGGVSDYTRVVADGLVAEGEKVHVWCPAENGDSGVAVEDGVVVHRELGRLANASLQQASKTLDSLPGPKRLLVQWVPHGYGYRSMNLHFAWWVWRRAAIGHDTVEVMVHEPFLPFGLSSRHNIAATVHRVMATLILRAASRVWISIPGWEKLLRPYALGRRVTFQWLPVPSGIPVVDDPGGVEKLRSSYAPEGESIVGHFGTYDAYMEELLLKLVPALLDASSRQTVLLLGKRSDEVRKSIVAQYPQHSGRVHATGAISAAELSKHISACDVMLQPYQDGVSTRRTSVMAALAHGSPVVTTAGPATETLWSESGIVSLHNSADTGVLVEATNELIRNVVERNRIGEAGKTFYQSTFDVRHTIRALQGKR